MPFSAARYRWRAKLDFYAAAGITLPEVKPINDEDVAEMGDRGPFRFGPSPVEQAARPNGARVGSQPGPRPTPTPSFPAPDVRPARPLTDTLDLSDG